MAERLYKVLFEKKNRNRSTEIVFCPFSTFGDNVPCVF